MIKPLSKISSILLISIFLLCSITIAKGSAQVTYGGGGNASASYMQSKTDADYKSVQEQSGLYAGNGGFDINVAKNTDLKGAVIASDASADKNTLTTETLTYSDISNRSKYSASSFGGSISASWSGGNNTGGGSSMSISAAPMLGIPSSGSVSGTTRSAVAPGTINTTSNIASLSRDTKNANGSVKNIFDKKKVATDQEVAQVFSEVAYHAVGDIAKSQTKPYEDAKLRYEVAAEQAKAAKQSGDTEKQAQAEAAMSAAQNDMAANQSAYDTWKDGSPAKIALHALVGTLSAAMGKGDIAGGALGAGISEALSNVTNQLPKALQPLASALIGAAVSQATGGNPMSGGSTALAGELYNRKLHEDEIKKLEELKKKWKELGYASEAEAEERLGKASCALTHCADGINQSDYIAYDLYSKTQAEGNTAEYARERALLSGTGLFKYTPQDAWRDQNYKESPIGDINTAYKLTAAGGVAAGAARGSILNKIVDVFNKCLANPAACGDVITAAVGIATNSQAPPTPVGSVSSAAGPGKVVLGKYPDYINLADELGAKRFSIPTEIWNQMSKAEQWAANQKFLDRAIQRGDDIILSNSVKNLSDVSGAFRQELEYLIKNGFKLSNDGTKMIRK